MIYVPPGGGGGGPESDPVASAALTTHAALTTAHGLGTSLPALQAGIDGMLAYAVDSLDMAEAGVIGGGGAGQAVPLTLGSGITIASGVISATGAPNALSFKKVGSSYGVNMTQAGVSTVQLAANVLKAVPFLITAPCVVDQLQIRVTTGVASSTFRCAIYADDGACYPGAIVSGSDPGTYDSASTGQKTQSAAFSLSPGLYWLAFNSSSNPTLRGVSADTVAPILGNDSTQAGNPWVGYTVSSTYGAMPSTYPGGGALYTATAVPGTSIRIG